MDNININGVRLTLKKDLMQSLGIFRTDSAILNSSHAPISAFKIVSRFDVSWHIKKSIRGSKIIILYNNLCTILKRRAAFMLTYYTPMLSSGQNICPFFIIEGL